MKDLILNNDAELLPVPTDPQPGVVHLANDSNFDAAFSSKSLTDFAGGFSDTEGQKDLHGFVVPSVPCSSQITEFKVANSIDDLRSEDDNEDVRPLGDDFKRIEISQSNVTKKLQNRGLTIRLEVEAGESPRRREVAVTQILGRLWRNDIRRAITALAGAATVTARSWDTEALKDPDQDLMDELQTAAAAMGVPINRILFGGAAWQKRYLCQGNKDTAAAISGRLMSPEQLALVLRVEAVHVARERYAASAAASTKTEIVGSNVFLFNASSTPTPEDPSNIKRFYVDLDGKPYRVYEHQVGPHLVDISVEHYSEVVITNSLGIRKLSIT